MGFEDDPVFRNPKMPVKAEQAVAARRKPYHLMTAEERDQAWTAVREAQKRRSKRISRTPILFAGACIGSIIAGITLIHFGHDWGGFLLWASVAFAGFSLIAFVKGVFQGLPWKDEDMPDPPGF
ncbi:MAG: hypothetical protein KY455_07405 [Euryarchaeota archaeon]|nr:hypothetical protein [Euryarchaeota archaeon]